MTFSTASAAGTGNTATLNSNSTISETGAGLISAAVLATTSVGGETLTCANAVAIFSATNSGGGAVKFNDTIPVVITALSQSGLGNVTIGDTGGSIGISGTLAAGSGNNTALTANGAINETGTGLISGAGLTTTLVGSESLNGANALSNFNGTNSGGGDVQFNNTTALTVTGITKNGTGNVVVTDGTIMQSTVSQRQTRAAAILISTTRLHHLRFSVSVKAPVMS
jgi:hypothetical protein